MEYTLKLQSGFHLDFFGLLLLVLFFVRTKSHNEQCDGQMETSTKTQNEKQKAITSNKRHLPVLVQFYLKNKKEQRRAAKGNERQMETRTKNQNERQKATKSILHSHFH